MDLNSRLSHLILTYGAFIILTFFFPFQLRAQTVKGKIIDSETSEPLPGVNIVVKGTTLGAFSKEDGTYSLSVPSLSDTLVFSFIGYSKKEILIKGRNKIDVSISPKTLQGQEAVITAFGEKKKRENVVGAVSSLDSTQLHALQTAPSANLTTSLAGRVPGLIAFQRSGEPGANNADFFVRGVTTFGHNASPLILIDNIKSSATDLANLNPNDIANFTILKDATATSLYGSEAANGVLLITTKEGHRGKLQVDFRIATNISRPTQVPEIADPVTFMKEANQTKLSRNPLGNLPYSQRKIEKTAEGANPYLYPATDWRDILFKDHTMDQRFDLHINGGGKVATYYVSGSVDRSTGLMKVPRLNDFNNNINLKNYSLRSNVNVNLTDATELKIKIGGNFNDYSGPIPGGKEVYRKSLQDANPVLFPPYYPVDSAHVQVRHPLFGGYLQGNVGENPYAETVAGYKHYAQSKINAQFRVDQDLYSLTRGLRASAFINIQRYAYSSVNRSYSPYYYRALPASTNTIGNNDYTLEALNPDGGTNYLDYKPGDETVNSNLFLQAQTHYQRRFGGKHGVNGFFVFTARNQTYDNAGDLQASLPHRNVNVAGRATYDYNHLYYAEFTFGLNASERFAINHRWGFFPTAGIAWNVSNEKFWRPIRSYVNRLKLKATYGFSGNDNIGGNDERFQYLSKVNLNDGGYGYQTGTVGHHNSYNGISISRYSNTNITWERAKKINLAINLGLFHTLDITSNLYYEDRTNIFQERIGLPASLGVSSLPSVNTGEVRSHGFSTHMSYNARLNKNWSLQLLGNFTFGRSKIVKYAEYNYANSPNKSHIDQPVGVKYGFYAERLFIDEAEVQNSPRQNFGQYGAGDIKYRDINGDGQITKLDQVPMGFPVNPEINYGFGFSAAYKNVDFSAFFEGLARESFWISVAGTAPFIGEHALLRAYADDHWTAKNRNITALYPHFSNKENTKGFDNNLQRSTWFMRNGSFLRIKDVQIGYTLPQSLVSRLSIKRLRIYVNGRNLAHFSKFKLWDPEMAGQGLGYPLQQTFNLGIHAEF